MVSRVWKIDLEDTFDLGIRKDWPGTIPPAKVEWHERLQLEIEVPQDALTSLAAGGLSPADINHICLSHLHFDHIGDPDPFTNTTFILGQDSRDILLDGTPHEP